MQQPDQVADALVELALSRGSRDNVTVVAVTVQNDDGPATQWPRPTPEIDAADSEDTLPGFTAGTNRVDKE